MSKIPRISNFSELVEGGIGQPVSVFIKDDDPTMGPVLRPSNEMIEDVVDYVFLRLRIGSNRDLESLCSAVARISVGRMAMSQGFVVEPGPLMQPTERFDVTIRPEELLLHTSDIEPHSI